MGALQLVVCAPPGDPLVAGLPPSVRAARQLAERRRLQRVLFLCEPEPFTRRWSRRLKSLPWAPVPAEDPAPLKELLSPKGPVLALASAVLPDPQALEAFIDDAAARSEPSRLLREGRSVALYHPDAAGLRRALPDGGPWDAASLLEAPGALTGEAGSGWSSTDSLVQARVCEDRLFAALPQPTDGFIARLDRRLSMALSRRLLRLPVSPNHITTLSLLLGLLGSGLLVSLSYPLQVLGAVLLWSCCILDGCDGEVARLKLMCSRGGGLYDVWADNVVHAAIFVAIPLHAARLHPETDFRLPGLLLLSGFLLSAFWVWRLVLSRPKKERGALDLLVERLASRDFIYLVLALTIARRLHWFLWTAALGSHAFWLLLLGAWAFQRRAQRPA